MQLDVLQAPPDDKAPGAFKTISEAAGELDVPPHVLRFWESHFPQVKPLKLRGGRRYYRPGDMDALFTIKRLLYQQGYTIKGARKFFHSRKQVEVEPTKEPPADDGRRQQLAEICRELMAMRETLKGYLR